MSESTIVVGIDGGGSKTRVVVSNGAGHILTALSGAASGIQGDDVGPSAEVIAGLVHDAMTAAGKADETPSALCAGVAGAGRDAPRKRLQRELQSREIADRVIVTTDAHIALADAFGDGPGVLLVSGTGSVCYGRGPTDIEDRCGGWGARLGDEGSALWLSLRALSAATSSADGREPDSTLLGAMLTATQCDEPADLIAWAARAQNDEIAALAPAVLRTAENGDLRANTVAAIAAEELVLHVRTLARRLFVDERAAVPVALAGGLLARGSLVRKLVEHRLRSAVPGAMVRHEEVDAARGAVRLALKGGAQT